MSVAPSTGPRGDRIPLVAGAMVAILVLIGARVAQLTILDHADLARRASRQHRETVRLTAMRGAIRDRFGEVFAETMATSSIYASPRKYPVAAEVRPALAKALGISPRVLDRKLDAPRGFVWLKRRVPHDEARAVSQLAILGVGPVTEGRRVYPQGPVGAHVVGFSGSDLRGLEGIELRYDRWMRGPETVLRMQRDGLGRALMIAEDEGDDVEPGDAEEGPFAAGASLTLTIDAGLQALVERELAIGVEEARAQAGTAVLLDPKSGEVLALANVPTYDPNKPGVAIMGARRNRAVTDAFEPGSTLKAILMATALEERTMKPTDSVFCERGQYRIGKWTIHDHHPYGLLTMPEVIQFSSNIGVSKIAAGLGRERYGRYLERFGFGHRTSIDLPGEIGGIVRPFSTWAPIDLATGSFGQGLSVTPIQLAAAYGALANGGVLHQPHLLRRAVDRSGRVLLDREDAEAETATRQVISPETARAVTSMLERVVEFEGGTGGKARMEGVRVAGKTGTAQKVDPHTGRYSRDRLASFVGFAPADAPAYVLLVMIDTPRTQTYGGLVAAPVFREIMSRALDRLGERPAIAADPKSAKGAHAARTAKAPTPTRRVPKGLRPRPGDGPEPGLALQQASMAGWTGIDGDPRGTVPAFLGMSLRRALETAAADSLSIEEARGSGFVKAQDPPAGTPRYAGDSVVLLLEPSL